MIIEFCSNQAIIRGMASMKGKQGLMHSLATLLGVAAVTSPWCVSPQAAEFDEKAVPFFGEYCLDCHSNDRKKAGVNLESYAGEVALFKEPKFWQRVVEVIETREMPPEDKPQPKNEERFAIASFLRTQLKALDCDTVTNPGRVTIRRLNRIEYNNTIQDLFLVDLTPADEFPNDEVGYGFDNIADVLSIPPILMEKYLDAAEKIATTAILPDVPPWPPVERRQAEGFVSQSDDVRPALERYLGLYREGSAYMEFTADDAGPYRLEIKAHGDQAGPEPPKLGIKINGGPQTVIDVPNHASEPGTFELNVDLKAGDNRIEVAYLNNFNDGNYPVRELAGDRNLFIDYIDVVGPTDRSRPALPASHTRIIPEQPQPGQEIAMAQTVLRDFATRAFRRPATREEVNRLSELVRLVLEDGGTFEQGIQLAVQATIASPKFLFRWELDRNLLTDEEKDIRHLNSWEMASRLSYFLWNSMPDDELMDLATDGRLTETDVLNSQIDRMIQDPKSSRFIGNFVGQWLQIRNLETHSPDPGLFPDFTLDLRMAMKKETELLFEAVLRDDLPVQTLIDSEFTYVNKELANHYGFPEPEGEGFVKVLLPEGSPRGGVLTNGSILTITSNPTRTSPVIRGKWILEQILGTPPPPPPPNVPELEATKEIAANASLRQRLEIHRDKPDCAGCHAKMDPIGFAFENFDAIGRWRVMDENFPIDPSGTMPDGTRFNGPSDLKKYLTSGDTFTRALTEKMLTYALGRGLEYYDECAVAKIVESIHNDGNKFSALIKGIVFSDPFQKKQTKDPDDE